jgi:folate-binding Fe-S cluster repair protein YgfZ
MLNIKENKEQFWLEKFDCFSITGKDSKRFLNGITTGNIVDLNNKVLKSCWLSPNGILKSLLEINCSENELKVIILVGNTSEIKKYFNDIIFPSDDVSLSDTFSINRLQQVDDMNPWRITQPVFLKMKIKNMIFITIIQI